MCSSVLSGYEARSPGLDQRYSEEIRHQGGQIREQGRVLAEALLGKVGLADHHDGRLAAESSTGLVVAQCTYATILATPTLGS